MHRIFKIVESVFDDGFKALSIISTLLSTAFTIARIFEIVPALRQVSYAWAFAPVTILMVVAYVRRWLLYEEEIEKPRAAPLSLATMNITDIAEYLFNESEWAWLLYGKLNFWEFVRNHLADEMTRAGREAEVRYLGARGNLADIEEINRAYWMFGRIDGDRVLDRRNDVFTEASGGDYAPWTSRGYVEHRFGSAPRTDVMRTWPRASWPLRIWVKLRVWSRINIWPYRAWILATVAVVVVIGGGLYWWLSHSR